MSADSDPTTQLTQEFLAVSADQPVQSLWKRGLKRLFTRECHWHKSSRGYGYSATWVVVSGSDGSASVARRRLPE